MAQNIHPTAYIAPNAALGDNVTIGPFAVIESG
ncbi:MAG: acyl-[acyl-carrier-protein]--UDP-N-acetylglucosamine O-acyltransferase, partial [Methylococcaceae bacterium]|nr:acyl-[acyl-carrier-protein]--UDP-N-acetylglucosamine O-acyltransferase [Methylococcaceae bacterium]